MRKDKFIRVVSILLGVALILNLQVLFLSSKENTEISDESDECTGEVNVQLPNDAKYEKETSPENLLEQWKKQSYKNGKVLMYERKSSVLMIGVPVTRWPGVSASLINTLSSIINNTSTTDQQEIVVTVVLLDKNQTFNNELVEKILLTHHKFILLGFLQIIQPQVEQEKDVNRSNLSRIFESDIKMLHIMAGFCKSDYYLHLADDVICAPFFYLSIKSFIHDIFGPWQMLEFSELGFVGKLVRSEILHKWAIFMSMFSDTADSLDNIFFHFRMTVLQRKQMMLRPTLFQRNSDAQKWVGDLGTNVVLRDRYFDVNEQLKHGDDPDGSVLTNMVSVGEHKPHNVYRGATEEIFWARSPNAGDWLAIVFDDPILISKIIIQTGFSGEISSKKENELYSLHNAIVEISPKLLRMDLEKNKMTCADYKKIGEIHSQYVEVENKISYRETKCLRITVTEQESESVMFQQISVFVKR